MLLLRKHKVKAYTQRIEENLTLCGNPDSIRQLISILLDNALKYSDEHGSIRLDVYKVHGKTKIEVFNTCILEDTRNLSPAVRPLSTVRTIPALKRQAVPESDFPLHRQLQKPMEGK